MAKALVAVTLLVALSGSDALADALDQYRKQCTSSDLAALQKAIATATDLVKKANAALPPNNSTSGARFNRWFGGPEGDYDPTIKAIYGEMETKLIFQKFWCLPPNSNTPEEWFYTNAFIPKGSTGEIFVTYRFFELPEGKAQSRGGTIVHEVSHQSSVRSVIDHDVDGDGKNDYGPANAQARARKSPQAARMTADNFKYFAEDVVFGVP